ncbi:hypothetical protein CMEL01_08101 [Colletotrichum melonis]|uniref:Uncharacterized protein n=1 Tax=Colletotrichum melonis TaxID=1209925 RepID=A0AAI9XIB7_9PEZI|nr:hypothetical protein CMEL01_08101 [Colletotrichum melonis]
MTMGAVNALVDFCKCHWSMDYSKDKCHCFDPVEEVPKDIAEKDAGEDAEK